VVAGSLAVSLDLLPVIASSYHHIVTRTSQITTHAYRPQWFPWIAMMAPIKVCIYCISNDVVGYFSLYMEAVADGRPHIDIAAL